MPLDPVIAGGFRGIELQNPLEAYARVNQLQQLQQQNQLNALKMQEYQRGLAEQEQTRNFLRGVAPDKLYAPETLAALSTQYGKQGVTVAQNLTAAQKAQADLAKVKTDTEVHRFNLQKSALEQYDKELGAAPDRATAIEILQRRAADPVLAGTPAAQVPVMTQAQRVPDAPDQFAVWKQQQALGMGEWLKQNKPHYVTQTTGDTTRVLGMPGLGGGPATVVQGSTARIGLTEAQRLQDTRERQRIKLEGDRVGLEGRRVDVLEENQRRAADPAFQQQMANAKATGEAIAKGDVAAQQVLPKVISRAEDGLRLIDEMIGKQEVRDKNGKVIQAATKPHPGFEGAVGATVLPGARFVPGTDAADFNARFDQLKGASFLEAFEILKGGGAITETEGTKATAAINRMSLAQSEKEFVSAARDLQDVIRRGVANARTKAAGLGANKPAAPAGVKFLGFE